MVLARLYTRWDCQGWPLDASRVGVVVSLASGLRFRTCLLKTHTHLGSRCRVRGNCRYSSRKNHAVDSFIVGVESGPVQEAGVARIAAERRSV